MNAVMVHDPQLASDLIARRRASGLDRYDEVWDGVYVMSPMAKNEHQSLVTELSGAITSLVDWKGIGQTFAGANVSDRDEGWTQNYRIPDVLVFNTETSSIDCGTHWRGGPELAIEIVSPGDRTTEKREFYATVGTNELLVVDRDPWQLALYRLDSERNLARVGTSTMESSMKIASTMFPVSFALNGKSSSLDVFGPDNDLVRAIKLATKD